MCRTSFSFVGYARRCETNAFLASSISPSDGEVSEGVAEDVRRFFRAAFSVARTLTSSAETIASRRRWTSDAKASPIRPGDAVGLNPLIVPPPACRIPSVVICLQASAADLSVDERDSADNRLTPLFLSMSRNERSEGNKNSSE